MSWQTNLTRDGFVLLPAIFSPQQTAAVLSELELAFAGDADGVLRTENGSIYGARNLLQNWPNVANVWRQPPLSEIVKEVLGPDAGLVRVLYFDKPPERSWALPWHKDLTIAVQDNRLPTTVFCRPTRKIGVPHVEAPEPLLEKMLTLRWHLDDVSDENRPLQVLPGSHAAGKTYVEAARRPVSILCRAGDVLLMRPLLSHGGNRSHEETKRHRRILHHEFAGVKELPDGYAWHDFITV